MSAVAVVLSLPRGMKVKRGMRGGILYGCLAGILLLPAHGAGTKHAHPGNILDLWKMIPPAQHLARMRDDLPRLIANPHLTDKATRQMLTEAHDALTALLGTENRQLAPVTKLVPLCIWVHGQQKQRDAIMDARPVGARTAEESFVLRNPLLNEWGTNADSDATLRRQTLMTLVKWIQLEEEQVGPEPLEALMSLYLYYRPITPDVSPAADTLLRWTPEWTVARFPKLSAAQKRQFLEDLVQARHVRSKEKASPYRTVRPLTPEEEAAYAKAYEFVQANTPQEE